VTVLTHLTTIACHSLKINFSLLSDMFKRLDNPKQRQQEWTRNGTLINKPDSGWLHPDKQLAPHAGVIYGVRVCT